MQLIDAVLAMGGPAYDTDHNQQPTYVLYNEPLNCVVGRDIAAITPEGVVQYRYWAGQAGARRDTGLSYSAPTLEETLRWFRVIWSEAWDSPHWKVVVNANGDTEEPVE